MKVLHVVKTPIGARPVFDQVRVLLSQGVEVVIAIPPAKDGFASRYHEAGAAVVEVDLDFPVRQPWRLTHVIGACRDLVKRTNPDLIHVHHVGIMYTMRMALGKQHPIPRIYQVAGPLHLEHGIFAQSDIRSAGSHDYWIATCSWMYKKYGDLGVKREHVFLSYLGIDITRFGESPGGRLRRELGISAEVPLVGMVAYMYAPKRFLGQKRGLKGHEDFIEALSRVRRIRPNVRGVIIGGAWAGASWYEERVRELGRLCCNGSLAFLGTREDVPDLYPDLDLAVVPSHSENVGPAIEPLLSGVAVVASKLGGLPDLVQEDKTGFVAPAHNPEALAGTIINVLDHPDKARKLTAEGQKLARYLFDVERTGREVADIYSRILARSAASNQRKNVN